MHEQVLRFDPALGIEEARTPPASWHMSPAYDRGWYAPKHEGAILHFHRLLAKDLRGGG